MKTKENKVRQIAVFVPLLIVGVFVGLLLRPTPKEVVKPSSNTETFLKYYIEGCMESGEATYKYCSCSYEYIVEKYGFNTLLDESTDYVKTGIVSEKLNSIAEDAVNNCI